MIPKGFIICTETPFSWRDKELVCEPPPSSPARFCGSDIHLNVFKDQPPSREEARQQPTHSVLLSLRFPRSHFVGGMQHHCVCTERNCKTKMHYCRSIIEMKTKMKNKKCVVHDGRGWGLFDVKSIFYFRAFSILSL